MNMDISHLFYLKLLDAARYNAATICLSMPFHNRTLSRHILKLPFSVTVPISSLTMTLSLTRVSH